MRISDWSSDVCSSDLDSLRAAFDDCRGNRAVGDIGKRLRCEHDRDVFLAQHLQPFTDARGKQRIVEEHPCFIQNEQGRAAVRSEEHTSELQSLMRTSYAVFCLKKKIIKIQKNTKHQQNNTCKKSNQE